MEVSVKLNIPSLGTINPTKLKNREISQLMKEYMMETPIPIIHY